MKFELADCVRIKSKNQLGYICDGPNVDPEDGSDWYLIDCFHFCDSEEIADWLISAVADDLEPVPDKL